MRVEIVNLPKSEIELKIEVPVEKWQEFWEKTARDLSKDLKIDGFRPGTAPLSLIEEKIGKERILMESAERCIEEYYLKAISENKIEVLGQPVISILKLAKDNPLEFKARVAIMPKIKLADYKKIALETKRKKVLVEEGEIEETLSWLQRSRAKFSQKIGACQKGDWVEISLGVFSENLSDSSITDAFILGEGKLIPGLEEKIEGMEAGQEKEFSLSFPKDHYQKELAGKTAQFKIKLESVQKIELPEINDSFAQNLGNFSDLPALKKSLKEGIFMEKEMAESQRVQQEILEKIRENSKMEIPEVLLNSMKNQMFNELKEEVKKRGVSFEDYLKKINKSEDDLLKEISLEAEKRIERSLLLREISQKENIAVSGEEIKEKANEILRNYSTPPEIDPAKFMEYTGEILRNKKTLEFLENLSKQNEILT